MMSSFEKTRFVIGGLLLIAAFGLGAGLPDSSAPAPDLEIESVGPPSGATRQQAPATPVAAPPKAAVEDDAAEDIAPAARAEPLLVLEGGASWYADGLAGRRTASGEPYDPTELIAAHRALPFGTRLRVTNLDNDRSVEVRVIDRGPFVAGRVLDLSRSAAQQIDMIRAGHARVRIEVLEYGS